ncbi:hypothetical protein J437_LFUL015594 [Ladona fulva]|uniref:Uncharacterized protein n=1 Tax=Ladona fulva TaxID=123851 RepID=A0A8K0K867_LADFU|nr:hypothetical protein J437_LFUL015594 [Ladona fulva]
MNQRTSRLVIRVGCTGLKPADMGRELISVELRRQLQDVTAKQTDETEENEEKDQPCASPRRTKGTKGLQAAES